MKDKNKTKEQLISELAALRLQMLAELDACKRERDFYQAVFQAPPVLFVAISPSGRTLAMNEGMLEAVGYTLEEVRGTDYIATFISETDRPAVRETFASLLRQRTPALNENHIIAKDGRELLVQWRGRSVLNDSGEVEFYFGVGVDITEARRSEEALRESEQKYRALVESSSDAILVIDDNRNIRSFNQAFLDLFGFEKSDVEGKSTRILHPGEESFLSVDWKVDSSLRGQDTRIELELRRKDGKPVTVEETLSPIRVSPDAQPKALVGILRDITARKEAEKQLSEYRDHLEEMVYERTHDLILAQRALVQKEKLKTLGAISAEVAHEIRNPLTAIGGFARRLQQKYPDAGELDIILSEARRLEVLLNRISSYLHSARLKQEDCSVNSVVEDILDLLSYELDRRGIGRHVELDPGLPPAYIDPGVLTQVFANVIRNALPLVDQKGTLVLKTFEKRSAVNISFRIPIREKKEIQNPELLLLSSAEGGQIRVPACSRLLQGMGAVFNFTQENKHVTFTISLPISESSGAAVA